MAKCIIVAHRGAFVRKAILRGLKELGYTGVEMEPSRCEMQHRPGREVPYLWEEEAVKLYRQYNAVALVVDPLCGLEGTPELLKLCPDIVVIGYGKELNPKYSPAAGEWEKRVLDAGVKATAIFDPCDPAPLLKEALDKALR